jgi:hypothetical protein
MTRLSTQNKERLVKATGFYFDLLINNNDSGIGYIGKIMTEKLNEAKNSEEINKIMPGLYEYNHLIKESGKDTESALLDMIINNIDNLIENIENETGD